jgi:hypothetical protein
MSKGNAHHRTPKPVFAMTGLVAGACVGMIVGLMFEIVRRRSMIVMQAGGIAGITVGALAESIRFWWRKRAYRNRHEQPRLPAITRR